MRVLVIGKRDVSYLTENVTDGFIESGHGAEYFDTKQYRRIDKYLYAKFTQNALDKKLKDFKPDFIFIVAPLFVDMALYEVIEQYKTKTKAIVVGWIGDIFHISTNNNEQKLSLLDEIFITDSGFDALLENKFESTYLPLATNPKIFQYSSNHKINQPIFVGSMTKHREDLLSSLNTKVKIVGNGWDKKRLPQHDVVTKSCSIYETARLYQNHTMAINIKNENNIINGLNQRSFDPITCGCLLVHDHVDDLNLNFDINKEILIYKNTHELDEILHLVSMDISSKQQMIISSYENVINNHCYYNRIKIAMS